MKIPSIVTRIAALTAFAIPMVAAPVLAEAQRSRDWDRREDVRRAGRYDDRRRDSRDEWRDIAIAAGGVGVLGLLTKDKTLTFAGAAGALYSLYRYNEDRRSNDRYSRTRADFFSRPYFYRDGVRYQRYSSNRNGQDYYYFQRHDNDRWDDRNDRNWRDNDRRGRDNDRNRWDRDRDRNRNWSGRDRDRDRNWDRDRDRNRDRDWDRNRGSRSRSGRGRG